MKIAIAWLILAVSATSFGGMYTEKELKTFMTKHPKCNLAVGMFGTGPELKSGEPNLGNEVMCVGDMKFNIGAINEAKGCAFALYNVDDDTFNSPYAAGDPRGHKSNFPMAEGTSCPDGGFDQLLKLYAGIMFAPTVKEALTKGPVGTQKLYLLAFTPGFDKWFESNVSKTSPSQKKSKAIQKIDCSSQAMTEEQSWECDKPEDLLTETCSNTYADLKEAEKTRSNNKKELQTRLNKIKTIYKRRTGTEMPLNKCKIRES